MTAVGLATPEFRLIAGAVGEAAGMATVADDAPVAGDAVIALARRHRLPAPVLAALARAPMSEQAAHRRTLEAMARDARHAALGLAATLVRVARALDEAGIRHLVLKGPALAQRLYGDVTARHGKDIDVVIEPSAIAAVHAILTGLGFARSRRTGPAPADSAALRRVEKEDGYRSADGRIEVELHWRLFSAPALLPLPFERLWQERSTIHLAGQPVAMLSPPHELLYLCCHGALHGWFRLKWLQDIARIVAGWPAADLAAAADLTHGLRLEPAVGSSLRLANEMVSAPIPPAFAGIAVRTPASDALLDFYRASLAASTGALSSRGTVALIRLFLMRARLRRSLGFKAAVLASTLVSGNDVLSLPLPRWAFPLYYPLRPLLLIARRMRGRPA